MFVFAVRHKASGHWIPWPDEVHRGRGGSHTEPTADVQPRLFKTRQSAVNFLNQWVRGIQDRTIQRGDGIEPDREVITTVAAPWRDKKNMEIVAFRLTEET